MPGSKVERVPATRAPVALVAWGGRQDACRAFEPTVSMDGRSTLGTRCVYPVEKFSRVPTKIIDPAQNCSRTPRNERDLPMKSICLLAAFVSSSAFAQYTGSYSERSQQLRRDAWAEEKASEIARAQQDNAAILAAAASYAQFRGAALPQDGIKCKTRRDIYWYGFNPPADDDAWGAIRYNICEFNVGAEACSIGISYAKDPIYVGCIGSDGVRSRWHVTNGRVTPYREGGPEPKRARRR